MRCPPPGAVLITDPAVTVSENSRAFTSHSSPAWRTFAAARASGRLSTPGVLVKRPIPSHQPATATSTTSASTPTNSTSPRRLRRGRGRRPGPEDGGEGGGVRGPGTPWPPPGGAPVGGVYGAG